jgi:hypothetical protein
MNRDRPGGPPEPSPRNIYSLGLQTSSSLVIGQQVRRRQQRGRQQRLMQSVLRGIGQYRQKQQQRRGFSSRGAGPLLGKKDTKRKRTKLSHKKKPKSSWWHPAVVVPIL